MFSIRNFFAKYPYEDTLFKFDFLHYQYQGSHSKINFPKYHSEISFPKYHSKSNSDGELRQEVKADQDWMRFGLTAEEVEWLQSGVQAPANGAARCKIRALGNRKRRRQWARREARLLERFTRDAAAAGQRCRAARAHGQGQRRSTTSGRGRARSWKIAPQGLRDPPVLQRPLPRGREPGLDELRVPCDPAVEKRFRCRHRGRVYCLREPFADALGHVQYRP